ncbi:hypothetical protein Tsubulata_037771 [Turnera subulata]|uniref:F-box domain-containing protein n=1 Tax=Turnera subulata TaxID=218843 RepID=A0A9Q0G8Y5_9ROSI|nr:hypothetical protein Tsubulata_037771 [Turnera subulata]
MEGALRNLIYDLPKRILLHILYRLPQREAHICMSVCKYWHSLLSHPSFAARYALENTRRHLSSPQRLPCTLYFLRLDEHHKRFPLTHITLCDRFWQINMKNCRGHKKRWYRNSTRVSFDFLPAVSSPTVVNQQIYCAGSSNGLVLCYELVISRGWFQRENPFRGYYVCNPLTRTWVAVPPGPIETTDHKAKADAIWLMGFVCDPRHNSDCVTRFKVVNVVDSAATGGSYNVEVFDSETWRWRTAMASWNPAPVDMGMGRRDYIYKYKDTRVEGIEFKGNLHWPIKAGGGVILAYDPHRGDDNDEFRLIKMPRKHILNGHFNDRHKICIGAGEGHLRYVEFVEPGCRNCRTPTWTIWRLENYNTDGEGWILENKINVNIDVPFGCGARPLAIDPFDPKFVYCMVDILASNHRRAYIIFYCDMLTAHTEVLESLEYHLASWRVVMHVLPVWPTLVPKGDLST